MMASPIKQCIFRGAIAAQALTLLLIALTLTSITFEALAQDSEQDSQSAAEISASLTPETGAVPGQRMRLTITIATPRWFTGGTRIALPEVPDVVILQNQDFASNASERRGAETWSLQRWTLDVFATRPGRATIPPIDVSVVVSISPSETREMTLTTPPLATNVVIPEELEGLSDWVASPKVSLDQRVDGTEQPFLGGAITRQITVKAQDVMAMMLPQHDVDEAPLLQAYNEPPVLQNRANRGALDAQRRDKTVWIAAAPGATEIPGTTLNWWNTESKTLTVLTTEAIPLTISGELPPRPLSKEDVIRRVIYGLAALLGVAIVVGAWRLGIPQFIYRRIKQLAQLIVRAWAALRAPGLPDRLNPGGSPARSSATSPPER